MRILSHRGYWKTPDEKNTTAAFRRSFGLGFGSEIDIRDCVGDLVISHDPPQLSATSARQVLEVFVDMDQTLLLALNIKADGLATQIKLLLDEFGVVERCFVFDMSVPDAFAYLKVGVPTFTRQSEEERDCPFYWQAAGVWLDCLFSEWYDEPVIAAHLERGKRVCLVSPELHHREHRPWWDFLARMAVVNHPRLMICTDLPEAAAERFAISDRE